MSQSVIASVPTATSSVAPSPKPMRVAFLHASWHADIVTQARDAFVAEMGLLGVPSASIDVLALPGAYELPLHAKKLAKTGQYDAIVACALVVDGGIYRHDFVAQTVVSALMDVQLETEVPAFSVVLTPHNFHEHAEHREYFHKHFLVKGKEAARACVATVASLRQLAAVAA